MANRSLFLGCAAVLTLIAALTAFLVPVRATTDGLHLSIDSPEDQADWGFVEPIEVSGSVWYEGENPPNVTLQGTCKLVCPRVSPPDDVFAVDYFEVSLNDMVPFDSWTADLGVVDGDDPVDTGPFCIAASVCGASDLVTINMGPGGMCPMCP